MERRTEQQIKAVLPFVCEFWDLKVSWICILNEQRGDPEPKKQEKRLEKVGTNRVHTKQNIVFRVCQHLELFVSSCSWEVPYVVKALKRENVLKPRNICWRKGFCVIRVSPMFVNTEEWRKAALFLQVISPAHKERSNISAKVLPLQSWGKAFFCRLQRHHWEIGGN